MPTPKTTSKWHFTQDFANYGGKGRRVADEWRGKGGFQRFLAHVGPKPAGHSIERIDNERGYEPGNVRWATRHEQAMNRSNTHWIEANGERLHVAEWARRLDTTPQNLLCRINRYGWDPVTAVTTPIRAVPKRKPVPQTTNLAQS